MEETKYEIKPFFGKCMIIELITVAIILLSVIIIKFCFPKTFVKVHAFYNKNILDETRVEEVLKEEIKR